MAILSARIADDKQAEDIIILEIGKLIFLADYFVIVHGRNRIQLQAIADEIQLQFKKKRLLPLSLEGYESARWVLLDYGGVVIHLFDLDTRNFYGLEMLWGDAPKLNWQVKRKSAKLP